MQHIVKILPSSITYKSEDNILDDALSENLVLEHGCKTGTCGICSAEIISGEVENENGKLVNNGKILTCCSKAKSDLVLRANYYPELAKIKRQTVPCKVANFKYVTDDIVVIRFRFPPMVKFNYLPGQYVDLSFKGIRRSYSIANAKEDSHEIELHIRRVPEGKMSKLLFNHLEENQLMRMDGPKGTFFVRAGHKPIILLAGGTGIAPIKAILEQLVQDSDPRQIYIYWGMSSINGFYLDELNTLSTSYKNIYYVPVMSGHTDWDGRTGLVHQAVCDDFASLDDCEVYACGSPMMIDSAKKAFIEKGLPESAFHSDAFTPAK